MLQQSLPIETQANSVQAFGPQLLKWIGNKQRFAAEIISYFPAVFGNYIEPFLGAGGVLGTLAPKNAFASDSFKPLMEIWWALKENPDVLKGWYEERWNSFINDNRHGVYERIKGSFNASPNGADLVFLCRTCYGGVVRFRQIDKYMSTPLGPHVPISPKSFSHRVDLWHDRVQGTTFKNIDFHESMRSAGSGDLIYCDPPYSNSQAILYGAQSFSLEDLFLEIKNCKSKGVFVALSIDGTKKSGNHYCDVPLPEGLFTREIMIDCGRSMLKRFQMNGKSLEDECVADRLLLTW